MPDRSPVAGSVEFPGPTVAAPPADPRVAGRRILAAAALPAGIGTALLVCAFAAAPQSCTGGLAFYFWCGIGALVVLAAMPFLRRRPASWPARIGLSLGLATFGVAAWTAGLFAANFRVLCRLF